MSKKVSKNSNFIKENKGFLTIVAVLLIVLVINIVSTNNNDTNNQSVSGDSTESTTGATSSTQSANPLIASDEMWDEKESKDLPVISFSQFKTDLKSKSVIVVMLGSDQCGWCNYQKPVLEHALYLYENLNVKYLNLLNITESEFKELQKLHSDLDDFGTPAFISIKNGKVVSVDKNGARGMAGLKTMLEKMGAI